MILGRSRTLLLVALGLVSTAGACRNQNQVVVPNRVLDRPLDVALACVREGASGIEVLSLNVCEGSASSDCSPENPQLVGFVTNSQRNEVAMFRKCDRNGLVDLDPESPGYSFVPVGELPTRITRTDDSCLVVSANEGTCDLSAIDVPGLAGYALDVSSARAPSSLVTTIVPRKSDGTPLASRPGDILAVPPEFSRTSIENDADDDDGGTGAMAVLGDPLETGGEDPTTDGGDVPLPEGLACDPDTGRGVWVTFPNCQLVAEVSLRTQQILQSRRFVTQPDGSVVVEDAGPDPECPIDCPAQFPDGVPDSPEVAENGVSPITLAFVEPPREIEGQPLDEAEESVTYASLFVGGTGNDRVFEIPLDGRDFAPPEQTQMLELEAAQGVHLIRVSPPALVLDEPHQFLYVVAGDGSTHVVDRDFLEGNLGVECDTQVDPTRTAVTACHPIDPNSFGNAPERRPFAVGPGIRTSDGSTINDWSFHKVREGTISQTNLDSAPFGSPGLLAVGVTSFGRLVYAHMDQYQRLQLEATVPELDPVGTMNVGVRPHMLWPSVNPHSLAIEALPRVGDDEPGRSIPDDGRDSQFLAPNLRRVDRAYALPSDVASASAEQLAISGRLSDSTCLEEGGDPDDPEDSVACVRNEDQLARFDDSGVYQNEVARVAVRDYQLWDSRGWELEWEGQVSTGGQTGIVQCDNHGGVDDDGMAYAGGTCRSVESGDTRVVDEGATFCEDGVLAGDTLGILGCLDDEGCGLGQKCLREPTAPASATGICVSEQAYESDFDTLRTFCAPFISDPCGIPQRRFRIVRAFDRELWLQAMDRPRDAIVRVFDTEDGPLVAEYEARLSCAAPIVHRGMPPCTSDDQCQADPYAPGESRSAWFCDREEGESEGVCRGIPPDTGCATDADCGGLGANYVCVDELCRAPCDLCAPPTQPEFSCIDDSGCGAGETCFAGTCHVPCEDDSPGCIETPLPGPLCFPEFVRYDIRASNSFVVTSANSGIFTDGVRADETTGECLPDPTASTLLTSRLWLGADEDETFNHPVLGIPDCPEPVLAGPSDPNPCRITTPRSFDPDSLFHTFAYDGAPVEAIRFSNPFFSITLDLVSLLDLAQDVPDFSDVRWPAGAARFRRSRIPRGYSLDFATEDGYVPYNEPLVVANLTPVTYPVRIVNAPELSVAYVVDAGGRGGVQGVRGQIVRVLLGDDTRADENFRVQ